MADATGNSRSLARNIISYIGFLIATLAFVNILFLLLAVTFIVHAFQLNVQVQSQDELFFGLAGDRDVLPDLDDLSESELAALLTGRLADL